MPKRWALLVGAESLDTSATALRVVAALEARGVPVAGFVQEPALEGGERVGHRLRRLVGGETLVVGRRGSQPRAPSEESFCNFVFDGDAFATARGWLERDAAAARVVVIHEVSKLEVAQKGHAEAVLRALAGPALAVLAVRADQLFAVMDRFALDEPIASLEAGDAVAFDAFIDVLAASLHASIQS